MLNYQFLLIADFIPYHGCMLHLQDCHRHAQNYWW